MNTVIITIDGCRHLVKLESPRDKASASVLRMRWKLAEHEV
jgi:hypothetical protein